MVVTKKKKKKKKCSLSFSQATQLQLIFSREEFIHPQFETESDLEYFQTDFILVSPTLPLNPQNFPLRTLETRIPH